MKVLKRNLIGINLFFIVLPIIIFAFGFLKIIYAIPFSVLISYCYYKVCKTEKLDENETIFTKKELIISIIAILIWLIFSGIGNFSYQNEDWHVRNAVLRDLINYDWPIVFEYEGIKQMGFVYYFAFWLPAALFGKVFGYVAANVFLFIWSFILLLNTFTLIKKYTKKNTFLILFFFIFFSGVDILGNFENIFNIKHIEWWNGVCQYSSNTTLLYWVFNQTIMAWLITILCLNCKNKSSVLFISPLIFAYSPFATIGMIPISIYLISKDKKIIKTIFSIETVSAIFMLIIFGSFYLSSNSTINVNGWAWEQEKFNIYKFILFLIVEVLIMAFFILKNKKQRDGLIILTIIELLLIPIYKMTPANDFCMRVSIVPLFILMLYFIKYMSDIKEKNRVERIVVILTIVLATITPIHEFARSVNHTFLDDKSINIKDDEIYSIVKPITSEGLELCLYQFYNQNLDEEFFSKYLMKDKRVLLKFFRGL